MKHVLRWLACLLALAGHRAGAQPVGTVLQLGGTFSPNPSALSRGPDPSKAYQRVMAVYPPADLQGVAPGANLLSLGFQLRTPAASAVSGTLRLWLRPSTDEFYQLTTDWAYSLANPVAFQQVYNGPLTIPATAGWFDVPFQVPFAYAGGGFYLAYEWETAAPIAASGSYECDSRVAQTLRAGTGTTGFPAQVATSSPFRPMLRVGYTTPGLDAAVTSVYGPGKTPRQACVLPYPVQAVVTNLGAQALTNLPVTFTPLAGAGQAVTTVVPTLAPGATASVRLPGLAPTAPAGTYVRYRVSVPPDQNPTNDSRLDSTLVTTNELTYVSGYPNAAFGVAGVGFAADAGSGTLLCRYPLRAPAVVSSVRARLWNHANNPGNTVFAVVLDAQGNLLARSADYVLPALSGLVSTWQTLALPQPVAVSGRSFFVGLAQVAPTTPGQYYYPLARQAEALVRDSAYYSVAGDSALTGLKKLREIRTLGRFMLEAALTAVPLAARPTLAPLAADVWPNPAAQGTQPHLHLEAPLTGPADVLDLTGRRVWRGVLPPAGPHDYLLPLAQLPAGCYLLQLPLGGQQAAVRLLLQ